jgi:hypothetical protein
MNPVITLAPLSGQRTLVPKRRPTKAELRRRELFADLWPGAVAHTWHRARETGFTTVPRTLSLVASLVKLLTDGRDASRVYLDLWCRAYDEPVVEVTDEAEFALSCGYQKGTRHVRTWQERIGDLQRLRFIAVRPKPSRIVGYILLLHPHDAVTSLKQTYPDRIPDWWWDLFQARLKEIGAAPRSAEGFVDFCENANGRLASRVG